MESYDDYSIAAIALGGGALQLIYIKPSIRRIGIETEANVGLLPIIIFIGIGYFVEMNVTLAREAHNKLRRGAHQILTREGSLGRDLFKYHLRRLTNEQSSPAALRS